MNSYCRGCVKKIQGKIGGADVEVMEHLNYYINFDDNAEDLD